MDYTVEYTGRGAKRPFLCSNGVCGLIEFDGCNILCYSKNDVGQEIVLGAWVEDDNKSRKTTLEERIAAVEYCLSNENNYALTAKEFNCSYGQVYSWVKKYNSAGVAGLYDRRGRSKDAEELTEIEKIKAENRLLKAQAKQQQMEIDFLKKLDAVERR